MRKLIASMFLCFVASMTVACGEGGGEQPQFELDIQIDNGSVESECMEHADCFPEHSFCVQGVCAGDPMPEILEGDAVEEDVATMPEVSADAVQCEVSTDCPLGHFCQNGQCMASDSPECLKNEDCSMGISCECKQGWLLCESEVCENFKCSKQVAGEQCEFGCDEGKCLSPECTSDADCAELDKMSCDGVWLLTVKGECYKGKCEANSVSGLACEFGCVDGECLPNPEEPECLTDADCAEGAVNICTDAFVLKSVWQSAKCVDGTCESETTYYNCAIPCEVGCYECWQNADCDDGNACTADYCGDHECMYENVCACKADANCDDGNACTLDSCMNGNCVNKAIENCVQCMADGKCAGVATGCYGNTLKATKNYCVSVGYCIIASEVCEFGCDANLGCKSQCDSAGDCNDGKVCTADSCADGKCIHVDNCLYGEDQSKMKCKTNADCEGTGFGAFCQSDGGQPLCQPCLMLPEGDKGCGEGEFCAWGITNVFDKGVEIGVSDFFCVQCLSDFNCDDGNPCTEDSCKGLKCEHAPIKGCFACKADTDCKFMQVCYEYNGADTEWTWTGKCLPAEQGDSYGKCEIAEKKCLTGCDGNACEKLECESDADCNFGQYCTDKFLCGWTGDLQCKFECPAGKKFAWVMSAKPDEAVESGTGVFKASPTTLCMWGWKNPAFKFNCWDGANSWSDGDKALVTCNEETFTVEPDKNYGSQGVQVVMFTNLGCGF